MSGSSEPGRVYLVGAGPGDPGLLTVRALELLRAASVVAYDDLVSPAVLDCARPDAELLPVGRRHGAGSAPWRLHPEVLARARAGRDVLRLKAGDPLVFGRGGEEARQLSEAGIPFEIVPGITAALGAASRAGIPLTHRGIASSVTFTTGHVAQDAASARGGTVVLYMAAHDLARHLGELVESGRPPGTPAAYVAAATTPAQRVVLGTLGDLASKVAGDSAPALVIVGEVVALRAWADWAARLPLGGWRIAVARARPEASTLAARLRALGADVVEIPFVQAEDLEETGGLDRALGGLEGYDGVAFSCAAAVDAVFRRLEALDMDLRALPARPWLALGKPAAERLRSHGIRPAAAQGDCAALPGMLQGWQGRRLLLLVAEGGREGLLDDLARLGVRAEAVAACRHVCRHPKAVAPLPRLAVLPSSTAARLLLEGPAGTSLLAVPMIAIGPRTEEAARSCGARDVRRAAGDTVEAVVAAVLARALPASASPA